MTKSEAIHHRAIRCRPANRNTYVTTHEALLAEAEYLQQTQHRERNALPVWALSAHLGLCFGYVGFHLIKGWFA